ncbi:MAG: FtsX-like permease family protein [Phycisphaerae bacterium]|nr:FtsX-like permease family protein [Phycisphaerae bacterium]
MRTTRLLLREIFHRKAMFIAGLLAVVLSVGVAVGSVTLLRAFDRQTESILQAKQDEVKHAWAQYRDDVRRSMLELGFNLLIVHKDQTLSTPDEETRYLPEAHVEKLRRAKLATINHVLPFLQKRIWWEEKKRWVTLYGTPGEVQINNPAKQVPMVRSIPPGHASLGRGIHESLGLHPGDRFVLTGREFVVQDTRPAEGFQEDEQIRVSLNEAQQMLNKPGLITGLMAINCVCEDPRGLANIRRAISAVLPDTQVREHKGNMVVRAEERSRAARETEASLQREHRNRAQLRTRREAFNAVLLPAVAVVAAVWLGLVTWMNVHHRRGEIAILRAIGWTDGRVFGLILGKAVVTGVLGGGLGYVGGQLALAIPLGFSKIQMFEIRLILASLLGAIVLAVLASWLPALHASRMDPAVVLQQE